jgi:hypothetical protein
VLTRMLRIAENVQRSTLNLQRRTQETECRN